MKTSFLTELLDLISPRACVVCGRRLAASESVMCASCHLHLPLTHYERSPLDNPLTRLFWGRFPVERATAMFFYEPRSDVAQMIYDMKYRGRYDVALSLGSIVARQVAGENFFRDIDVIVPMPITWRRKFRRGYNQSQEIARGISEVTGLPVCTNAIRRIRFVKSQTTQRDAYERLHNVEGAFRLTKADSVAGRHVLLVDDIITTGATVIACGTELAKAPGVRISVLSLGLTRS